MLQVSVLNFVIFDLKLFKKINFLNDCLEIQSDLDRLTVGFIVYWIVCKFNYLLNGNGVALKI